MSAAEVTQIITAVNASEARVKAYVAALLVNQWSDGKTTHPGIGLVVEQNQREIRAVAQKVGAPAPVALTDAQVQQIIAAIPAASLAAFRDQINK